MADPTIQSFCCRQTPVFTHRQQLLSADSLMDEFSRSRYIITSIIASALGMMGATYQILFRYYFGRSEEHNRLYYLSTMRQFRVPPRLLNQSVGKKIIAWLAVGDLLASSGVFIRSALWRFFRPHSTLMSDSPRVVFCAVISCWIQLFYTATWLWTLCYAINVRMYLRNKYVPASRYHAIVWPVAALLTGLGTTVLYYPNADCHNFQELWTALTRVLPNYCATYLPILVVLIINPIIYAHASQNITTDLSTMNSQFTLTERNINRTLKWKFLMINVVFYICWMPNLICGLILWTSWHNLPDRFISVIWYMMAILNPLQAFFNVFLYRKWQPGTSSVRRTNPQQLNERSPLLLLPGKNLNGNSKAGTSTTRYF